MLHASEQPYKAARHYMWDSSRTAPLGRQPCGTEQHSDMHVLCLFDSCFQTTGLPAGKRFVSGHFNPDLEQTNCLDDCQSEQSTLGHNPPNAMVGICVQGANHSELRFL